MCPMVTAAPPATVNSLDFLFILAWPSQDSADTSETVRVAPRDSLSRDLRKLAVSPESAVTTISVSGSESPDNHDQASKPPIFGANSFPKSLKTSSGLRRCCIHVQAASLETKAKGSPKNPSVFWYISCCSPDAPKCNANLPSRSPTETSVQLHGQLALDTDAYIPSARLVSNNMAESPSVAAAAPDIESESISENEDAGSYAIADDGDFGYREQDYCGPSAQASAPDEEDPFWEWDIGRQQFRHLNKKSGEMIYCPESFD